MKNKTSINFLILEDHFYSNKILAQYVKGIAKSKLPKDVNFDIASYKSGTECILGIHKNVDIAILDYYLTHDEGDMSVMMNGHEIMMFIKKMAPECKVIMVSSLRDNTVVEKIKKDGVFAYIDKHTSTHEQIGEAVERAIQTI